MAEEKIEKRKHRTGLSTLIWACLAMSAAGGAYVAVTAPSGQGRIVTLVDTVRSVLPSGSSETVYVSDTSILEDKLSALQETVSQTNRRSDELFDRVTMLENALGPLTAGLREDAPDETGALPDSAASVPMQTESSTSESPTQRTANILADPLIDTDIATGGDDAVVTATEFALELGPAGSLTDGRAAWIDLLTRFPQLLGGLSPRVSILEAPDGHTELRLVAGPIRNAATVASLCSKIKATGQACNGTIFEGQRIASR